MQQSSSRATGNVVFLETSALLRVLFGEPGGDEVRMQMSAAGRIIASRLLQVEADRAVLRCVLDHPEMERTLPDLNRALRCTWPHIDMMELTRGICELAGSIAPRSRLRSLDAIHLATFRRVRQIAPGAAMLSFDQRILGAL